MIRVLIADDHAIVRAGLRQIVAETADITVADEASNGLEVMEKISKAHYDVALLDISMPDNIGLETLKAIRTQKPALPILILTMHPEEQYAIRALRAGASGYVTKGSAPDELIGAIRKVVAGGKYVSSSLAERLASELAYDTPRKPHETLSDREYQVLIMIASGKNVTDIAEALSLSVKTVSTYRARIMEKLDLHNNVELGRYAIENHLID